MKIASDWTAKALADLAIVSAGQGAPKDHTDFDETGTPFIRAGSLEALVSGGSEDDCERVPERTAKKYGLRLFPAETILFAKSGMSAKKGRVYKLRRPAYVTNHLAAIIPRGSVDPDYLFRWLSAFPPTHLIPNDSYPSIRLGEVEQLKITLPMSAERQKRIAGILDKADTIRAKRREALAQADALLRSAFDHTVGFRAPGYESWEMRSIESLAAGRTNSLRTGPFGSDLRHSEFTDSGVVVLGIDNAVQNRFVWAERRFISPEKYRKLERYRVFPDDVIVTIMGTTGRSAVVPNDIPLAISTKHLATITLNREEADPHFVSFAIHSDSRLRRQIEVANKGAIMDGLNLTVIRSLKLRLPPLPLQKRFAELVRWHDVFIERAKDPSQNGDALYASLAQRAFRGEL